MKNVEWTPPETVSLAQIQADSDEVLSRPDIAIEEQEDIYRLECLGLEWDFGIRVVAPRDEADIAVGADGRRVGVLLLHGGDGDFKSVHPIATLLAGKFGYKVVIGTMPGRYCFDDPARDWPGDTFHDDGTVRTPIWRRGESIGPDEYEIVVDESLRDRYGTRRLARAKEGTTFHHRLAAWPAALEEGLKDASRRHLPVGEFSVYGQGHSTGGPFICMLSQRIENFAGLLSTEHSPFGAICRERDEWGGPVGKLAGHDKLQDGGAARTDRFDELYIRSWRDIARYAGPEALGTRGADALMTLPALMEDVFASWERSRRRPQFKCEYIVTHGVTPSLEAAARATATRLELGPEETEALVARFVGYTTELRGADVKPVPPLLMSIAGHSRDHSPEVYREVILPAYARMEPAPKATLTRFESGGHRFWAPEGPLALGIAPSVAKMWDAAITGGFFVV